MKPYEMYLNFEHILFQEEFDDFWCHYRSALVHPVGWSQQSGHKLHSTSGQKTITLYM